MTVSSLLIRGGRVIDPAQNLDQVMDLALDGERIVALGEPAADFEPQRIVDATGCVVCPGLIDLHAHLREPGFEHKGTIASETRAAARGGITTLCVTPDTAPVADTPAVVQLVMDRAEAAGYARLCPMGALTLGLKGEVLSEMHALKQLGCSAVYQSSGSLRDNQILRRAMEYAATFDLLVVLKPEDLSLRDGGCVHDGAVSARLGLPSIPAAAETVAVAQILALVAQYRVRVHLTQLSTAQSVEFLRHARDHDLPVTADVSAHQLHLNETHLGAFDPAYHVDPPLRTVEDQQALLAGVAEGLIQAISSGHSPHEVEAKQEAFPATAAGISSLESLLPLTLGLVRQGKLSLSDAIARLTTGPASVMGLDRGRIAVGQAADLCLFKPDQSWAVQPDQWFSHGKNTPFMGQSLTGKVCCTIFDGRIVYEG